MGGVGIARGHGSLGSRFYIYIYIYIYIVFAVRLYLIPGVIIPSRIDYCCCI